MRRYAHELEFISGLIALSLFLLMCGCSTLRYDLTPDEISALNLGRPSVGQKIPTIR